MTFSRRAYLNVFYVRFKTLLELKALQTVCFDNFTRSAGAASSLEPTDKGEITIARRSTRNGNRVAVEPCFPW